jgi:cobalt-zinc-cadmium efflux system protein
MSKGSLNVKAAFLHNLTDAAASLAVLVGGATIYWLDWTWVDPSLTLIIAGYILYMSFGMLRKTSRILMQGTPPELSLREVAEVIEAIEGVGNAHHLHVWELDEHHRALEAHVVMTSAVTDHSELRQRIKQVLKERFNIGHSTLELEGSDGNQQCADQGLLHSH